MRGLNEEKFQKHFPEEEMKAASPAFKYFKELIRWLIIVESGSIALGWRIITQLCYSANSCNTTQRLTNNLALLLVDPLGSKEHVCFLSIWATASTTNSLTKATLTELMSNCRSNTAEEGGRGGGWSTWPPSKTSLIKRWALVNHRLSDALRLTGNTETLSCSPVHTGVHTGHWAGHQFSVQCELVTIYYCII